MRKIYVPWTIPTTTNGRHPLVASLVDHNPPVAEFLLPRDDWLGADVRRTVAEFARVTADMVDHFQGHAVVTKESVVRFMHSRDVFTSFLMPSDAELTFFHTLVSNHGFSSYVLHLENPTTLFLPMLAQGATGGIDLRSLPVFWIVRHMLEQSECRAIFSHMKRTADQLGHIFDSAIIAGKTRHIPLGVLTSREQEAKIERALTDRQKSGDVVVLFTNSFHQDPAGFHLRGGLETVAAFIQASQLVDNLRLVLRSALPEDMSGAVRDVITGHPKITLIDGEISEAELFALYCEASIFMLPSAGLHALSVARAMHHGLVCITSDAVGFEEFVRDGVTGLVVPGRRDTIYDVDPGSGWIRDDYTKLGDWRRESVPRLTELLVQLARSPGRRDRIGRSARAHALTHLRQDRWVAGFKQMLDELEISECVPAARAA